MPTVHVEDFFLHKWQRNDVTSPWKQKGHTRRTEKYRRGPKRPA